MAQYQIMRWKGIPSQVKAFDSSQEVSAMLSHVFQEHIDEAAMQDGSFGSDSYLDSWVWDEARERPGTPQETLNAVVAELEAAGPQASTST